MSSKKFFWQYRAGATKEPTRMLMFEFLSQYQVKKRHH